MTARRTWKKFEQFVAGWFGTERTPLSGSNSKWTKSDTLHGRLYIECKLRKEASIFKLFKKIEGEAREEYKVPVLILKEKFARNEDALLICRMKDLEFIAEERKFANCERVV